VAGTALAIQKNVISAVGDAGARIAAGDLDAVQIIRPRLDAEHLSDVGDDPGEHGEPLSRPRKEFDAVVADLAA